MTWDRQFEQSSDFPSTPVKVQYVLCTTGRSGSHFLGHLLHARGVFGYPLEYMNLVNLRRWTQRAADAGASDVLSYIKSVRTSPNGCFGIKMHHAHLRRFLEHEDRSMVASYRFIMLTRRDLIAQAASLARARQTGAWISDMPEEGPATYDWSLIRDQLEEIVVDNARWHAFLHSLGLDFLSVTYEDVCAAPDAAVGRIAEYVGVHLSDGVDLSDAQAGAFMPSPQSGGRDWADRFLRESAQRFEAGHDIAGMVVAQQRPLWRRAAGRVRRAVSQPVVRHRRGDAVRHDH
jgi:trehalose 2-sulfotransferase